MNTQPSPTVPSVQLSGVPGSPYTRKMLAMLRYRRIPYRYIVSNRSKGGLPQAKPALLPTFYLPNEAGELQAVTDSTPLIRHFESMYAGRQVVPSQPLLAMLDALLEDYADEWLTKPMYHYRWAFPEDIDRASRIVPLPMNIQSGDEGLAALSGAFGARQVSRRGVVGSNDVTAPIIEQSYTHLLTILEEHFTQHEFLLGKRPGASDFALYGQLSQLALFDPTPMALTCKLAPRVVAWVQLMEDLSGMETTDTDWFDTEELPSTLTDLLKEVGRTYVPVMLANEQALQQGLDVTRAEVDGKPWEQQPFGYQAKCLMWLRSQAKALSESDAARWRSLLQGTGCERLFG